MPTAAVEGFSTPVQAQRQRGMAQLVAVAERSAAIDRRVLKRGPRGRETPAGAVPAAIAAYAGIYFRGAPGAPCPAGHGENCTATLSPIGSCAGASGSESIT
jgi:hypothetical protein